MTDIVVARAIEHRAPVRIPANLFGAVLPLTVIGRARRNLNCETKWGSGNEKNG